jgi:MraZ protein
LPFHGSHEHALDAKSRLTIPSQHRADLAGGMYIVRESNPAYLSLHPAAEYDAMAREALSRVNPLSPQAKRLKRLVWGRADKLELDGAGRIVLSKDCREHAGIERDVQVVGLGDYLEIWNRDRWRTHDDELTDESAELTETLGHPS